ncbi:hypothetical protein [Aureivirga marina]|uniref:hypothetical protein n=1 Tax=Aureivirga marina TaxID=1182451 RepID=UPI0018CA5BEB|nr:hypothetical protein [Aureivirga marina]
MKKTIFLVKIFAIFLLISSCEKEENITTQDVNNAQKRELSKFEPTVENGILKFETKEQLKSFVDLIKDLDTDEEVSEMMYNYYEQGFTPLFPFFRLDDMENFEPWLEEKKLRANGEEIDQEDNIINDESFAAVLTVKREVIVANKFYRYTSIGVLSSDIKNKNDVDNYITDNNLHLKDNYDPYQITRGEIQVSETVTSFAPGNTYQLESPCWQHNTTEAPIAVDNGFGNYNEADVFISSIPCTGSDGPSHWEAANEHSFTMLDQANYLRNEEPCKNRGWSPFGTREKCFAYHSDKIRAKTIFWHEDYQIYKSVGVLVKHQKNFKILGWHRKKADELAVIMDQVYFAVEAPEQIPDYQNLTSNSRLYYYDGKLYEEDKIPLASYIGHSIPGEWIPSTPFTDDIVIHQIANLPLIGEIGNVTLESEKLNEMFWENAWSNAESLMDKLGEKKPVTYIYQTPQKVYIQYVDVTKRKTNARKLKNTLAADWGFKVKFTMSFNNNGSVSTNFDDWDEVGTYFNAFELGKLYDFSEIKVNFMGMTRVGNSWKGSRMVFIED